MNANLMDAFPIQKCSIHKDTLSEYIVMDNQIRRACTLCPIEGNSYVISNSGFQSLAVAAISQLLQNESKSLHRHQQLTQLSSRVKWQYAKEDEQLLKRMLGVMQDESKSYKEYSVRINALKSQLSGAYNMINYFKSLKQNDLYEMKLNLSSEAGLKRFYKKCRDHAALIRKGVHSQFKKIQAKLAAEKHRLEALQEHSFICRLKEYLISRKMIVVSPQNTPKSEQREARQLQ